MRLLASVLFFLALACSGTNQTSSRGHWTVVEPPATSKHGEPIKPNQGEVAAVSCPAMPFREQGDRHTQLAFCERFSWDVSRCERQGWDNMTAKQTCQLVAEQDKRRAALEKQCMAQPMPPDVVSKNYEEFRQCSSPLNGDGTHRIPFCNETLGCFQEVGFRW